MSKQVEYEFRLLKVSAIDPSASREELAKIVNMYLQNGWQILNAETIHYEGNEAFSAYHFVKYETVADEIRESVPARRPGRPRKEVAGIQVAEDAVS